MQNLKVIDVKGVRVLTSKQLAECYLAEEQHIKQNFANNRRRFIEGKHYISLQNQELREFKSKVENLDLVGKTANRLYLWTEKGAFLHAKSLNTDKAWEVYDRLVDTYFKAKEFTVDRSQLSPQTQMFYAILDGQAKIEMEQKSQNKRIDSVKQELDEFRQDMPLLAVECDRITEAVHKCGVGALGGKGRNAYKDTSLRGKVYQDIHRELKRQFGVSTYKAIKRSQCDLAVSVVEHHEIPIVLKSRIDNTNAQLSMGVL